MKAHFFKLKDSMLWSVIIISALVAGCASGPFSPSGSRGLKSIEGKWSWQQNGGLWHGRFVLEKVGDSYAGTLDDTSEGTFGDRIVDVGISGHRINFTREGRFGVQFWEGTLKVEDGRMKIIDGQYKKRSGTSGHFDAERIE